MSNESKRIKINQPLQERAIGLFSYLKELASANAKAVSNCGDYEDVIWFHSIPKEKGCYSVIWGKPDAEQELWIEARKQTEPKCPKLPFVCKNWLESEESVAISENEPTLKERLPQFTASQDFKGYLELKDYPEISETWQTYLQDQWRPWSMVHGQWRLAQDFYSRLFSVYNKLKRLGEAYELILGLGLLTWLSPSGRPIMRHILAGQATMTFDPNRSAIRIQGGAEGVKLTYEFDMLEPHERPSPELEIDLEAELAEAAESPWDTELLAPILRSWVNAISPEGVYYESLEPIEPFKPFPQIALAPAIILRKRTNRNLISAFDKILTQIKNNGEIPRNIQRICEISEELALAESAAQIHNAKLQSEEPFFPLPYNDEQSLIVKRLSSHQGILVQGPPGTGKSHTIANLISHLLATGKRTLVTSQTPRALKVLESKTPNAIAPLCVNVLGNDLAALRGLEHSVQHIVERYSAWNLEESQATIQKLEQELTELKTKRAELEALLKTWRKEETENREVSGGAYCGTAQAVAKRVAEEAAHYAWFQDEIQENSAMPLNQTDFETLLNGFRSFPENKRSKLFQPMIDSARLPAPEEFQRLLDDMNSARKTMTRYQAQKSSSTYQALLQAEKSKRDKLALSLTLLLNDTDKIRKRPLRWIPQAVEGILTDHETPWEKLYKTTIGYLNEIKMKLKQVEHLQITFPENPDYLKIKADAEDLLNHLAAGGTLGWWIFRNKTVKQALYITETVFINGRVCVSAESLKNLIAYIETETLFKRIWDSWAHLTPIIKTTFALQIAEIEEQLEALGHVLALSTKLGACRAATAMIPQIDAPLWHDDKSLVQFVKIIEAVEAEFLHQQLSEMFDLYVQAILTILDQPNAHEINRTLLEAFKRKSLEFYRDALKQLRGIELKKEQIEALDALCQSLSIVAPKLAKVLRETADDRRWDHRIESIEKAWQWAQADAFIAHFHREHKTNEAEQALYETEKRIDQTIGELASERAWKYCFQRMTEEQRVHLMAWTKAVKKIGKGKGKYAAKHRADAQYHLEQCRDAIPAWVMPFYRAVETIQPQPEIFDVVIIDEASQSGPEALLLLYLAKQCIIVGDDQQISPSTIGVNHEDVALLASRYLSGIPAPESFDLNSSLFSQGEIRFGGRIILREHFRCMPEIIGFSNALCYQATPLKPLRQYPPERLEPIVVRHTPNGFREGGAFAINQPEAEALVHEVARCCFSPQYRDKSMGVISLQGEAQARLIEKLLIERIGAEKMERLGLICGDAYDFQGDERDVIFLSLVAAPNERIGALTKESDKRRFNVAASRAKDQLWLFHTASLNDLNHNCMRYQLLDYCMNPKILHAKREIDNPEFRDELQRQVYQIIKSNGYRAVANDQIAD